MTIEEYSSIMRHLQHLNYFKRNRKSAICWVFILIAITSGGQEAPVDKGLPNGQFRQEICLNGLWDFKSDTDTSWTKIRVPGLYSVLMNFNFGREIWDPFKYPMRWNKKGGIYQKSISLPQNMDGKVAAFYCGSSCFHTYVEVNNKPVGEFHDGFCPFEFLLNNALNKGDGENILNVRISEEDELTLSGESRGNRGMREDTYLKIYPEIYIDPLTTVVNTHVAKKQLDITIQVNNTTGKEEKMFVRNFVTDSLNRVVKEFDGGWITVPANGSVQKNMVGSWQDPHLWTLYDPYLYHLHTVLYSDDGIPFDKNTQRFGFREISIKEHHIYLNGEELYLHGNAGHDLGDIQGTKEYMKKWLLQLKKMGINFARMHVYPRHKVLYDAADEVGFLLEAEAAFHFHVPEEEAVWKMHLNNLVKSQRNHPCVFLWSVSNELRWNGGGEHKELIDYVRSLDNTRPVFASDFSLESRYGDVLGHHYNPETVFDEWEEFGPDKPMIWDELGNVWQKERPLYNGTAGYEASSQDWATGMWHDGHDQIFSDIQGMVDGKIINGELHRVNAYIPWDFSYCFMRWQPTNKFRDLWLQHDSLTGFGTRLRVIQPCASTLNIWDETLPEFEPNPGYYLFEKHMRTVRFFDTDDYQSYFEGTNIRKTGKLYYENLRKADAVHSAVELKDGQVLTSNIQRIDLSPGDIRENVVCDFFVPEVDTVTPAFLTRDFYREQELVYKDKLAVKLFPALKKMAGLVPKRDIAVLNNKRLINCLNANGLNVSSLGKVKTGTLQKYDLVIINNLLEIPAPLLTRYLTDGGKILVLDNEKAEGANQLTRKDILEENFKGEEVTSFSKDKSFVSSSSGLHWHVSGGEGTVTMNMVTEQYGKFGINSQQGLPCFAYARFDEGRTSFIMQSMEKGKISFSYRNLSINHKYEVRFKDRPVPDIHLFVCDKSKKWFVSDQTVAIDLDELRGDLSFTVKNLSWQQVEEEKGEFSLLGQSGQPDLSELHGAGLAFTGEQTLSRVFILTGFTLRSESLPAAKIPLNGGMHKLLKRLTQADFSFWRDGASVKKLELPVEGNFRTILLGNKDGDGAALYEKFVGKGIMLHSGLNISQQLENEPVAAYMLVSMLRYLLDYQPDITPLKCGILAENKVAGIYLQNIDLIADELDENHLPDLSGYHTLIVDGGSLHIATRLNSKSNTAKIRRFVESGGRVMFTAMNDTTIEVFRQITGKDIRLTKPYLNERAHCVKAAISWTLKDTPKNPVEYYDKVMIPQPFEWNYEPLISGIANKDLYWEGRQMFHKGIELAGMDPVIASSDYNILISNWQIDWSPFGTKYRNEYINQGKDIKRALWFVNRDPVLFKLRQGKGFYLFNQLQIETDNKKAVRVIDQLLTNLGCAIGGDNFLPSINNTFNFNLQTEQIERFKKNSKLLTPVRRSIYGGMPEEPLKSFIFPDKANANKNIIPRVLILGDGLIGQMAPVIKKRMGNAYEVAWNADILGTSDILLNNIEPYLQEKGGWDIILISVGSEDVAKCRKGERAISVNQYKENVTKIVERLKQTGAKIYMTTQPPLPGTKGECSSLQSAFNKAAKSVADTNDAYTYDLEDYVRRKYPDFMKSEEKTYTKEMLNTLGIQLGEALISFGAQVQ